MLSKFSAIQNLLITLRTNELASDQTYSLQKQAKLFH